MTTIYETKYKHYTEKYHHNVTLPQLVIGIARELGHSCGTVSHYDSLDTLATLRKVWEFDTDMWRIGQAMTPPPASTMDGIPWWEIDDEGWMHHQTGHWRMVVRATDPSINPDTSDSRINIVLSSAEAGHDGSQVIVDITGTANYERDADRWGHIQTQWTFAVNEFRPELLRQIERAPGQWGPGREVGDPRGDRIAYLVAINTILGGKLIRDYPEVATQTVYEGEGELIASLRNQPDDANAVALLTAMESLPAMADEAGRMYEIRLAEYEAAREAARLQRAEDDEDWGDLLEEEEA